MALKANALDAEVDPSLSCTRAAIIAATRQAGADNPHVYPGFTSSELLTFAIAPYWPMFPGTKWNNGGY
ncbi:hypothetical protein QO003_000724 [Arthrobacter silviterrae]|nr:hypothetical protein [Arthrobacter silviterrae]